MSLPVCQVSLPRLANSGFWLTASCKATYGKKKNEFASLPRFLSRGARRKAAGDATKSQGHAAKSARRAMKKLAKNS
jgi:hypothetical protein